jgi:hypothetical protein
VLNFSSRRDFSRRHRFLWFIRYPSMEARQDRDYELNAGRLQSWIW